MTKAERLARKHAADQAALDAARRQYEDTKALLREEARTQRAKRRATVGTLADHAGLLALDDTTLFGLFTLLTGLGTLPNPVAVLEAALRAGDVFVGTSAPCGAGASPLLVDDGEKECAL
jgi:hypothetical protein